MDRGSVFSGYPYLTCCFFPLETIVFIQRLVQIPDELCGKFQMRYLTIQSYRMLLGG